MSRNLPSKVQNASYASLTNTIKSRISPSPKNRPARLGTRSMTKSPTQTFIHNNSKVSESNISKSKNLKSRKDILAEISPQDRIELTHGSHYDGRNKDKISKQNSFSNAVIAQSVHQKSKNKGGDLIKKIVSKKGAKSYAQRKETGTREMSNKRIREDLRDEEQDIVYDKLDLPNNFITPLSFVKNLQVNDSKKKEAKLSASLMLSPEQSQGLQQQSDSRFQSLTNVSSTILKYTERNINLIGNASTQMYSRHGSNKFTDLEMELDFYDKRHGHYKRISDAKFSTSQVASRNSFFKKILKESDTLSSNAYKLFKYQRSQERAKLEATAKNSRASEASLKSPGYSTKLTPRKESPELTESENPGAAQNCSNCDSKNRGNKVLKKRKKTGSGNSPSKIRNYSAMGDRSAELYKNRVQSPNLTQGHNIMSESMLYNDVSRKSPYVFAENKEFQSEPYSSSIVNKGLNNSCISPNSRAMLAISKERFGTEPQGQTKGGLARMQAFFREKTSTPQEIVDLDNMNVKQLIQLKNLIDEKIEVEELKNKTEHIKMDKKLKKALGSPSDEKLSQQKRLLREQLNPDENTGLRVSSTKNFSQPDTLYEKAIWRAQLSEEKLPLNNKEGLSFNMSYLRESNLKKHDMSSPQFNLTQPLQGDNGKSCFAYSYAHGEQSYYKDSRLEIEENYNKKLREFLEARDKMLQMTDASVEEVDLGKLSETQTQSRTAPSPADLKGYNGFVSLSNLLKMNSPEYLQESDSQGHVKHERELMIKSMMNSPTMSKQIAKQKGSHSCLDDVRERLETAHFDDEFEPWLVKPNEGQRRRPEFSNLKVKVRKNIQDSDLMSMVNQTQQRDVHKDRKSGQRTRSFETQTRLTKKEMMDIISKANDIEDTPSESNDENIKQGNYLKQDFKLARESSDHKSLARILNNPQAILQEDSSVLETPTLNPNNMDSKNTSTILETDLSILAINKKLAVMKSDLIQNNFY